MDKASLEEYVRGLVQIMGLTSWDVKISWHNLSAGIQTLSSVDDKRIVVSMSELMLQDDPEKTFRRIILQLAKLRIAPMNALLHKLQEGLLDPKEMVAKLQAEAGEIETAYVRLLLQVLAGDGEKEEVPTT